LKSKCLPDDVLRKAVRYAPHVFRKYSSIIHDLIVSEFRVIYLPADIFPVEAHFVYLAATSLNCTVKFFSANGSERSLHQVVGDLDQLSPTTSPAGSPPKKSSLEASPALIPQTCAVVTDDVVVTISVTRRVLTEEAPSMTNAISGSLLINSGRKLSKNQKRKAARRIARQKLSVQLVTTSLGVPGSAGTPVNKENGCNAGSC